MAVEVLLALVRAKVRIVIGVGPHRADDAILAFAEVEIEVLDV